MKRTLYAGDSVKWSIPLTRDSQPFAPGDGWTFLMTGKRDPEKDTDEQAVFQKSTEAGISLDGTKALIDMVSVDTDGKEPGVIYCDIRGQHDTLGRCTVAVFTVYLSRPITRETQSSIPIYTTEPPAPGSVSLAAILALLGTPSYANLTAANAALLIGRPYYDLELSTLNVTTS